MQTAERETAADPRIVAQIREKLDYTYPYAALSKVSGKRNASALDEAVFTGAYVARSVPAFLQPDGLTPAEKGTAMHTFMQYCDYAAARADLEQEIARVQSAGYLRPEEAHTLDRQNRCTRCICIRFVCPSPANINKLKKCLHFATRCGTISKHYD